MLGLQPFVTEGTQELLEIQQEYSYRFHNYCFEIQLSDEINYTYRVTEGVARNQKATYFLQNKWLLTGRLSPQQSVPCIWQSSGEAVRRPSSGGLRPRLSDTYLQHDLRRDLRHDLRRDLQRGFHP